MTKSGTTKEAICCQKKKHKSQDQGGILNIVDNTYDRTTDTDPNGQFHLAFHRHPDRCNMFSSIGLEEFLGQCTDKHGVYNADLRQ